MSLRHNTKILCLALVSVFVFSAIAAGVAQAAKEAPVWTVGGKTNTAAESKKFTMKSIGALTLDTKLGFTLTSNACSATGAIFGSGEGSPGTSKEAIFTCSGVEVEEVSTAVCQIHSPGQADGTIKTESLTGTLVWLKKEGDAEVGDLFKGVGAEEKIMDLEITGAACPVKGLYPVTGTMMAKISPITSDVTTMTFNFPTPPIEAYWTNATPRTEVKAELKIKALTASLTGKLSVTGDELWGIELG